MGRPWLARFAAAAVLLALTETAFSLASSARAPLTFDVGPSTGAYLAGFTDSEEQPPVTSRWARSRARIELPLEVDPGQATLVLRCARFLDEPVRVQVYASGAPLGTFVARPGRFRVLRLPVRLPAGRLRLEFGAAAPDDLAFVLDWVRLEGARVRLPAAVIAPRALVAGVFLLALLAGFSLLPACAAALAVALGQAAFLALDPFGMTHVLERVTWPALVLGLACVGLLRGRTGGRRVVLIFLGGYLLKGAAVFYPSYFYNDVRNDRRYVEALRDDPGSLIERSRAAQVRIGVAYPRVVAGKKYAFPYSPVFFLPFGWLPPTFVDEGMKHAVVAAAAAPAVIVFLLAGLAFGPEAGLFGALLAAFLPVYYSRLLLALWATLGGHLFDCLALLALSAWALRPASRARLAAVAACVQASYLTYVASLFNLSLFTGYSALLLRRLRLLVLGGLAALLTVALLYRDFTLLFVREILPAYLGAPPGAAAGTDAPAAGHLQMLAAALGRVPLFYGWLCPLLAAAGLALGRRRADPAVFRVLVAHLLTFVTLVLLRGLGGGLFKDMKEIEFAAPLVALTAGAALDTLGARGRAGLLLATALAATIVASFVLTSFGYFRTWTALAGL